MSVAVVIDDDPQVRCLIAVMLKRAGYQVAEAENGEAGSKLCATLEPEVIVTDIFMPEQDGIEVLRHAKSGERRPRVVAISGGSKKGNMDFLVIAEKLGADAVIQKPFTPAQLLEAVTGKPATGPS